MKRYLLLLLISITTSTLFAQTNFRFADSTAQWNVLEYNYGWFPMYPDHYSTTVYSARADTVVNSTYYQQISSVGQQYFLRRDSLNRIYQYKDDTSEYFLYDFGKQKGDTIKEISNSWGQGYLVMVDSIDSINIGHWRKRMFVHGGWDGNFMYGLDTWIEGIGSQPSHFLHPITEGLMVDGPDWTLICYFENASLLYHDSDYDTCNYNSVTSIDNIYNNVRVKILPNPTSNFITIQSQTNLPPQTTFQLFDITGRMVLQKQLTDKTTQVELDEVNKGMYLYNITVLEKKMGSGKLVVQ